MKNYTNPAVKSAASFVGKPELSADGLRNAYAHFPTGVTAICSLVEGVPVGMAASSFTSVSLDPPLVSVCVARSSKTWPILRAASHVGVSVLSEDHGIVARALAAKSGNRFVSVDWTAEQEGSIFVSGSVLWLECTIVREIPAGDHEIILLGVERVGSNSAVSPIIFHGSRFRALE